ncbi:MAG: dTDP-4-dehydrorhamnose 3,5-epimerase [Flammeovirgaceae bacterium]|nr:dTDP-4-dehydrorhamnose 3,5-epimerase [Flammeovirgaceae bacterium]
MQVEETHLSGCFVIKPKIFRDPRGYFFESYNQEKFEKGTGKKINFVQDNQSQSSYGVIRGLHYQLDPYAQAKLVTVLEGKVLDVCVDVRMDSPTYGQHFGIELSAENKFQLFIPRGFAHGFVVLSETAIFQYKCDNFYAPQVESGIIFNDPEINIDWKIPHDHLIISEKDKHLKTLKEAENNF